MNPEPTSQPQSTPNTSRNFKCPCGRTYLSYPALYTHIKNKHDGQPPGQIQKPKAENKTRGRPPAIKKQESTDKTDYLEETKDRTGSNIYKQDFEIIKSHLRQINVNENIDPSVYLDQGENQQNTTIKLFQKFMDEDSQNIRNEGSSVVIGTGLAEFFQAIHGLLPESPFEKAKSEHIFLLFMLLLQYSIDVQNDKTIISTMPIQSLIEYINPFMSQWIEDYSQHKGISNLWIMKRNNMTKIFYCFYSWLKLNQYTSFCITLFG